MSTLSKSFVVLTLAVACALPSGGREARPASSADPVQAMPEPRTTAQPGREVTLTLTQSDAASSGQGSSLDPAQISEPFLPRAAIEAAGADPESTAGDPGEARDAAGSAMESISKAPERVPWLRIERGEGQVPLLVPRDEELVFRVIIDVGILGEIEAGQVVLSSGVERYVTGLPAAARSTVKKSELEMGWIKSFATGGYSGYRLEHGLQARLLPQVWPRVFYTDKQSGSENRRREIKLGLIDGQPSAWYRNDGHCKGCENREHFIESRWIWGEPEHCKKCKRADHRVWKAPTTRVVPVHAVDMLSAVYLARSMVCGGIETTTFPLVDKQKLWDVWLRTGRHKRISTPAGAFDAREIKLSTSRPPGEPVDPANQGFEGMFGIRGTIQIWLDSQTGVPVRIEGQLPIPVIGDLDVRVELTRYRGTPDRFSPVE